MSAIYAWLRRHPVVVDSFLAAVLGLISLSQVVGQAWANWVVAIAMVAPIVVRRRFPVTALTICFTGGAWQVLAGLAHLPGGRPIGGSDIAVLVLIYTAAAYRPRRVSVPALLICLAGCAAAALAWVPGPHAQQLLIALFLGGLLGGSAVIAWVLGDSMRYRRGYYAALEDRAARLEAERHAEAKIAAAAERARIARELHDIVAHHVSVMVVQADGAGYALRSDPDRAQAALEAISGTGRQALTEMRRLLGLLRSANDTAVLAPLPGLGELRELLDQARAAGLEVSYILTGTPRELPEGAELAAYRVVQESLTNTRKHAGLAATAAVTLRYEPDDLIIEIVDDGVAAMPADGSGHGLAGMRERVEMYGGTVQAGPLPSGGFAVTARLPCGPDPQGPATGRVDPRGADPRGAGLRPGTAPLLQGPGG
jgi:signal transduction histidine kinase